MVDEEIKDEKTLEQVIATLKGKKDILVTIPGVYTSELLNTFKKHGINYSRIGFKRWRILPKTNIVEERRKIIVAFRAICLISTIILLILFIYDVLSLFWIRLELYFISLPLAGGIVTGVIFMVLPLLGKTVFKRSIRALLRSYLWGL